MTPLFSCPPPPPFVRFSISFACGQIRAICRPAGFPDGGGEISKADRLRPFMQQLPPFSSHSPVRYQLLLLPLFPGPGYHFQYSHQIECSWPRHVEQRLHFKTCPCQLPCPFSCNRSATPIFTVGGGVGFGHTNCGGNVVSWCGCAFHSREAIFSYASTGPPAGW